MSARTIPTDHPVPAALSHVVLRTAHLDEKIEFYDRLIGMHVNYRSGGGAALSYDGEHHRMALVSVEPGAQDPAAPGLEHIAYKMRSLGELLGNYRRLQNLGTAPFMALHHGGTLSAYYLDPDGVQVETFVDAKLPDLTVDQMAEQLAENPIGIPVDFDDLATRYEAGEPIASILEPPPLQDGQLADVIAALMKARGAAAA